MVGFIKDSKVIKGRVGGVWGLVCVCVGGVVWHGNQKAAAAGTDAGWESWLGT